MSEDSNYRLLFICSRNEWRSRTAEEIFKNWQGIDVRSAGTQPSARVKISEKLMDWADLILVMEHHHKKRLLEKFPHLARDKEIVILDIPDEYPYMDEELIEMLKASVAPYLE